MTERWRWWAVRQSTLYLSMYDSVSHNDNEKHVIHIVHGASGRNNEEGDREVKHRLAMSDQKDSDGDDDNGPRIFWRLRRGFLSVLDSGWVCVAHQARLHLPNGRLSLGPGPGAIRRWDWHRVNGPGGKTTRKSTGGRTRSRVH